MSDDRERLMSGDAWRDFCARLLAAGENILGDEFPQDERGRAEGYRALTRLLVYAAQQEIEAGDPLHPSFVRHQNLHNQWGGPNPDNVYLRANIDPTQTYRVWAEDASAMRQAIFSLHEGDMQLQEYGVFGEVSLREMKRAADGGLEIIVSPDEHPGNWMPMHEKARIFTIRIYQSDWAADSAPNFMIERVGAEGVPPGPLDPAYMARALDRTVNWVEKSSAYWNHYTQSAWERSEPNVVNAAGSTRGGADNIQYGNLMWELAPGEALLLTCEEPEAEVWGWTIHTMDWLESGAWGDRQTSLSGHQMHLDDDGRMRVVIAHEDPGCPNWIDTEGRARGMCVYRWVWTATNPKPECEKIALADVRGRLPEGHPQVDAEQRRCQLAGRRAQAWARFR